MRAVSLMYHDVVKSSDWDSSGFPGNDAAQYKMRLADFDAHLAAIAKTGINFSTIVDPIGASPRFITFDDGGVSAIDPIADSLEAHGWRGHFFITTDRIGDKGFVNTDHIRSLHKRGHIVGSHSASHPTRMAACTSAEMRREWVESVARLSEIVGETCTVASVPGGYYSREVGLAAADAGIKHLFTSEPTTEMPTVMGCEIYGRYTIKQSTPARVATSLAMEDPIETTKQAALWKAKKIAKLAGPAYLFVRSKLLKPRS